MNQPAFPQLLITTPIAQRATHRGQARGLANPPVLAVVWCRSVGTCWTLELHQLHRGTPEMTLLAWICSGVPISEPEPPQTLARALLAEHGLALFSDSFAGPRTGTRCSIGYASGHAELIALARLVAEQGTGTGMSVMLAAQWVTAGYSAEAAARWIRQGVHSPQKAQRTTSPQPMRLPPRTTSHSTCIRPQQVHQP